MTDMLRAFSSPDFSWLAAELARTDNAWSMGSFGAIGEFMRDGSEIVDIAVMPGEIAAFTPRGGLRLVAHPAIVPVAYETPSGRAGGWNHGIALCLPQAEACPQRSAVVNELGPDAAALRPEDRTAILFNLGAGGPQADLCVRTADPELIAVLRGALGRDVFDADHGAMAAIVARGPHRVFLTALGRLEVYQPIPPADGKSPEGPHTHLMPKLLKSGQTHAATTPIPDGLVPCASLFPAHPQLDLLGRPRGFDDRAHMRFQELFQRFGVPHLRDLKQEVIVAVARSDDPRLIDLADKHRRAVVRVALRQLAALGISAGSLSAWQARHDREAGEAGAGGCH